MKHIAALLMFVPTVAWASGKPDAELSGDRPDFTDGTDTVARGHGQIEAGIEYGMDSETVRMPDALIRLGLSRHSELRLVAPSFTVGSDGDNAVEFGVGAKISNTFGDRLALGVLPSMGVTGGEQGSVGPGISGLFGYQVHDKVGLASNLGVSGVIPLDSSDESMGETEYSASLGLGVDVSESIGIFGEVFAVGADEWVAYADGGVTVLVSPTLQLDAYGGTGVGSASESWAGVGFVWMR